MVDGFPFLETVQTLNQWILGLNKLGSHRASKQLYVVLQALYQQTAPTPVMLELLDSLAIPVITYADKMEHLVLAQQCFNTSLLVRKTAALSGQLLRLLSLNYCKLSITSGLMPELRAIIMLRALHIIGLSQCKLAALKQTPSEQLWVKTAELYLKAQQENILMCPLPADALFAHPQRSLFEVLQRNFLFMLCDPYFYDNSTVKSLFRFANTHYALLTLDAQVQQADFSWTPQRRQAPRLHLKTAPQLPQTLYFNSQVVAALLETDTPDNLNQTDLSHLKQHLTGYRDIIDSAIPSSALPCQLLIDFDAIHVYLGHQATIKNINRVSTETGKPIDTRPRLQLTPLTAPRQTAQKTTAKDNDNNPFSRPLVSVHATQWHYYFVVTTTDPAMQIDRPLLFVDKSNTIKLGLIQQITAHPVNHGQQHLIKQLPGSVESVQAQIDSEAIALLLIIHSNGDKEVLLPTGKYQSGTLLTSKNSLLQGNYVLTDLLGYSPHTQHFKISLD